MEGISGLMEIETRCAGTTVRLEVSLTAPAVAVMMVEPADTVVASPETSMVATDGEDEVHVTPPVKSELLPSVYVAVAVNCCPMPIASVRPTGVTAMEAIVGVVTLRLVDCVTPEKVAEIFVIPDATEVTNPLEAIVAICGTEDCQDTEVVKSALLPSL
jgi:hypothetical protein